MTTAIRRNIRVEKGDLITRFKPHFVTASDALRRFDLDRPHLSDGTKTTRLGEVVRELDKGMKPFLGMITAAGVETIGVRQFARQMPPDPSPARLAADPLILCADLWQWITKELASGDAPTNLGALIWALALALERWVQTVNPTAWHAMNQSNQPIGEQTQ
ncbi:hypothetical protein [Shimia sp. MIT1388]|uniref:hypothetical protein n=1 Tax=Shimia sp. MIT1388 TaxID=3096992 RepID=UPI00399A55B1